LSQWLGLWLGSGFEKPSVRNDWVRKG